MNYLFDFNTALPSGFVNLDEYVNEITELFYKTVNGSPRDYNIIPTSQGVVKLPGNVIVECKIEVFTLPFPASEDEVIWAALKMVEYRNGQVAKTAKPGCLSAWVERYCEFRHVSSSPGNRYYAATSDRFEIVLCGAGAAVELGNTVMG